MPSEPTDNLPTIEGDVWFYHPNIGAAIFFAILFFLIAVGLLWQAIRLGRQRSTHAFLWVVIVGLCLEVAGFGCRAGGSEALASVALFATQSSLIVLAPLFIAAGDYVCITRLICAVSGRNSTRILRIPARLITKIFVTCDVLTILVQVSGTSISAGGDWVGETADTGSYILLAGLALQTLTLCFFVSIVLRFGGAALVKVEGDAGQKHLDGLRSVLVSSIAIWLRCIYRLAEYATGFDGYLFTHEWNFYLFEGTPMVIATGVFVLWYPPYYVLEATRGSKEHGRRVEVTAIEA